ncbi:MAG: hybrid sensor histidine kinase/response regulator, partial [Opitutaceae bacterium]
AVHFTPEDGAITVKARTNPGGELVVEITDTGIGIASNDLTRIFETFSQGDTAPGAARRSGGLGLGLSISRKMVELHGGSIDATSPGRGDGSTFTIRLPLLAKPKPAPAEASGEIAAPHGNRSEEPGESTASRGRILLVDDHAPTQAALQRLLQRRNFEVLTARSVAEALEQAHQHDIDFIISDIGLPDGDGYALMNQIRQSRPNIRGIALSGYGSETDVARSRNAGFVEHLIKPVNIAILDRALDKLSNGGATEK